MYYYSCCNTKHLNISRRDNCCPLPLARFLNAGVSVWRTLQRTGDRLAMTSNFPSSTTMRRSIGSKFGIRAFLKSVPTRIRTRINTNNIMIRRIWRYEIRSSSKNGIEGPVGCTVFDFQNKRSKEVVLFAFLWFSIYLHFPPLHRIISGLGLGVRGRTRGGREGAGRRGGGIQRGQHVKVTNICVVQFSSFCTCSFFSVRPVLCGIEAIQYNIQSLRFLWSIRYDNWKFRYSLNRFDDSIPLYRYRNDILGHH